MQHMDMQMTSKDQTLEFMEPSEEANRISVSVNKMIEQAQEYVVARERRRLLDLLSKIKG